MSRLVLVARKILRQELTLHFSKMSTKVITTPPPSLLSSITTAKISSKPKNLISEINKASASNSLVNEVQHKRNNSNEFSIKNTSGAIEKQSSKKLKINNDKENIDPKIEENMLIALLSESLDIYKSSDGAGNKSSSASEKSDHQTHQKRTSEKDTIAAKPSIRPFTVSVEGNIGSGKSTFLKHFTSFTGVSTYQEPLEKWTDVGGYNLLGKLYEDPKRWSFLFQSYVQLTRLNIHLANDEGSKVKLIERSLHNNRYCFVENGYESGYLQEGEYNVLCEYFSFLEDNLDLGVDLIVYLRSSPEIVHKRMMERGRTEEAGVPLAYLKRIHESYEDWLMHGKPKGPPAPVLVIDADCDLEVVMSSYQKLMPFILGEKTYLPNEDSSKSES